jgi:hypothetical protein
MIEPITALGTAFVTLYTAFSTVEKASQTVDHLIDQRVDVWTETHALGIPEGVLRVRSKTERTVIDGWNRQLAAALHIDYGRIKSLSVEEIEDALILTKCIDTWHRNGWAGLPSAPQPVAEAVTIIKGWGYFEKARALQFFELLDDARARAGR